LGPGAAFTGSGRPAAFGASVVVVVVVVVGAFVGWKRLLPKPNLFAVLNLEPPAVENLEDGDVGATDVEGSGRLKEVRKFGLSVTISRRDGRCVLCVVCGSGVVTKD